MDFKFIPDDFYEGVWFGLDDSFKSFSGTYEDLDYILTQDYKKYKEIIRNKVPSKMLIIPKDLGLKEKTKRIIVYNESVYNYELQDTTKTTFRYLPYKSYGVHKDIKILSYTSHFQSVMHICCYMGFKKIYLIGGQKGKNMLQLNEENSDIVDFLEKKNNVKIVNIGRAL